MQIPQTRRSRQAAAALALAVALGALAGPVSAGSPIAPSAAELAGITQASGPKRCVVRHDGVTYTNLQAGVDAAEEGETVTLQGTCAGFAYIDKDLTIRGVRTERSGMPTITGRRTIPLLHIAGLEVESGSAAKKVSPAGSDPGWNNVATIIGVRLMRGFSSAEGAIFIGNGSGLILRDAIVTRNRGTENGAIDGDDNNLLILRGTTEISYNRAIDGDGGGVDLGQNSRIEMHGQSRIHHNRSWEDGGGVWIPAYSSLLMYDDSSIDNNRTVSDEDGAGIDTSGDDGLIELNDRARIAGNRATADGGGIHAGAWTIILNDDSRIVNNTADQGGGVRIGQGMLILNDNARLSSNYADEAGGVYAYGATQILLNDASRLGSNRAVSDYAGGIYASENTVITLSGSSRITRNRAVTEGGGVYLDASALSIEDNARLDGNRSVSANGGGVWATYGSAITAGDFSAIEDNRAAVRGGGVYLNGSTVLDLNGSAAIRNNIAGDAANSGGGVWASCAATLTDVIDGTNVTGNTPDQVFWETC